MSISPAPIQSPLNQRGSLDPQQDSGKLTLPWIQWFNELANAAGGGGGTGATVTVASYTMTANTTITAPGGSPAVGDLYVLFVGQNATGGWVATFNAAFKMVTSDDVDPSPLRTTILQFVYVGGSAWWLSAAPFSRDTP
jgi:hypothetical protein